MPNPATSVAHEIATLRGSLEGGRADSPPATTERKRTLDERIGFSMALLAAGLTVGCSEPKGSDYFPVSKSQRCEYNLEYMAPLVGVQHGKAFIRGDGEEVIAGKTYVKTVTLFEGIPGTDPDVTYYRKAKDGIWAVEGTHKDKPEFLFVPLPVDVGASWRSTGSEHSCDCKVESKETAELVHGKYEDSFKLACACQRGSDRIESVTYLAPGVGMVRSVVKVAGVTMEFTIEQCE